MIRRNFLRNAAGLLIAAPFVVKAENLMRVVPITRVIATSPRAILSVYTPELWSGIMGEVCGVRSYMTTLVSESKLPDGTPVRFHSSKKEEAWAYLGTSLSGGRIIIARR